MPHKYKKRTDRADVPIEILNAAVEAVKKNESIRSVAQRYNISKSTLHRHIKNPVIDRKGFGKRHCSNLIFTKEQENLLVEYFIRSSKLHYGLTKATSSELIYKFAKANKIKYPNSWDRNHAAGKDWMRGYFTRNQTLSLRKPEPTSLSRSTSFNKTNVENFFNNLKTVYESKDFRPENIYNLDETGFTTVHRLQKIVAFKGAKQVGKITSAERGSLVTVCL